MREKLIELLTDNLPRIGKLPKCDNPLQYTMDEIVGRIADHLIANGVTIPVRCKDCDKGRPIDKTKCPEKYFKESCVVCLCEQVVGDEPMIYEPTHFCSYGERRNDV